MLRVHTKHILMLDDQRRRASTIVLNFSDVTSVKCGSSSCTMALPSVTTHDKDIYVSVTKDSNPTYNSGVTGAWPL